jgi:hypothetical protein
MINPIVIPLGNGSLLDNIELRYSLRAIDKFASGYTDIVIVGKLPYFVRGVMCIPLEDSFVGMKRREGNILSKINAGLRAFDRVVAWNDDYYLTKPTDLYNLPYYFRETDMQCTIDRKRGGWQQIQNTRDYLVSKSKPVAMYDGHCPIIYEKALFNAVNDANWDIDYGYGIKSLYSNVNDIEGVYLPDTKIMQGITTNALTDAINSSFLISSSTMPDKLLLNYLEKELPHKSKWEV